MTKRRLKQGAELLGDGVSYSIWAPERARVTVEIADDVNGPFRPVLLAPDGNGYHHAIDPDGRTGQLYRFRLDDSGPYPCPASRWQPSGLNGPSLVVDPSQFHWSDADWIRPPFRDLAIYELHLGTFTKPGTFRAAIEKLPALHDLGINAIELMPIADFPGNRNWGYDGVRLYAPAHTYGSPDDLRALVNSAHRHGIAVILDVVYNHFGPDGNFLREFSSHYFQSRQHTPWGEAINFDGEHSKAVRDYFIGNITYWMDEFHIDGFRLDATHAIYDSSPLHILREIGETVHARRGYIIAEDERNEARLIDARDNDGYGFDAVWADDFHHSVEVATIEASTYGGDFEGELHEVVDLLEHGWSYRGEIYEKLGEPRGTNCNHLPPDRFVYCLYNHDQVGNRAFGERLHHLVRMETWRACSVLFCLSPYAPLLFMGQEWAASAPFLYFTDHEKELGRLVEEGRTREFEWIFARAKNVGEEIPSPQAPHTFERSKLDWEERERTPHAGSLLLYKELLHLRRGYAALRPTARCGFRVEALSFGVLGLRLTNEESDWLIVCDLHGGHEGNVRGEKIAELGGSRKWSRVLSSNEPRFGGSSEPGYDEASPHIRFPDPEAILLRASE